MSTEPERGPGPGTKTFTGFLAELRERKVPIGVREHLLVDRLLSRWDDPGSVRDALAALLARNPEEVELIREAFDEWFTPPRSSSVPPPPPPSSGWKPGLTLIASLAVLVILLLLGRSVLPNLSSLKDSPQQEQPEPAPSRQTEPQPPEPEVRTVPDWPLAAGTALALATGLVFWLRRVRIGSRVMRLARQRWAGELDALPGPQSYRLRLPWLAPQLPRNLLDDLARILGRSTAASQAKELDVDRSLEHTLRAGLAPHLVMRSRRPATTLLVLEDVSDEMRHWRHRTEALLRGLTARGLHLDHWRFNGNAGRVFRSWKGPFAAIEELARTSRDKPLLVLSTGLGILEGEDFRTAPWVDVLPKWPHRVWVHPIEDPRSWRETLKRVPLPVYSMDRHGLLAAARRLAALEPVEPHEASELARPRKAPQRPVTPLDVDRLRWLLSLAPRRDPALAELLRQRFCPDVPAAAVAEALDAPAPVSPPGIGPTPEEVHTFLFEALQGSRPEEGTAGYERWRLDRALQAIHVDEDAAREELARLAGGPLALEVERALERLDRKARLEPSTRKRLRTEVLTPLRRRARREGLSVGREEDRSWLFPTRAEILTPLLCAVLFLAVAPRLAVFQETEIVPIAPDSEQITDLPVETSDVLTTALDEPMGTDMSGIESMGTEMTTDIGEPEKPMTSPGPSSLSGDQEPATESLTTDMSGPEPMGPDPGFEISPGTEVFVEAAVGDRPAEIRRGSGEASVKELGQEQSECNGGEQKASEADGRARAELSGREQTRVEFDLSVDASSDGGRFVKCSTCLSGAVCLGRMPVETAARAKATARATATVQFLSRNPRRYRLLIEADWKADRSERANIVAVLIRDGREQPVEFYEDIEIQGNASSEIRIIVELSVESTSTGVIYDRAEEGAIVTLTLEPSASG